jgi:hypothetical protein
MQRTSVVRAFLIIEAAAFFAASAVHAGLLVDGFEDPDASLAERIIGAVLVAGLVLIWMRPTWTRRVGLAVQGFALLGDLVGLTLAIRVGPTTVPDLVFHGAMVVLLVAGLVVTARSPAGNARRRTV